MKVLKNNLKLAFWLPNYKCDFAQLVKAKVSLINKLISKKRNVWNVEQQQRRRRQQQQKQKKSGSSDSTWFRPSPRPSWTSPISHRLPSSHKVWFLIPFFLFVFIRWILIRFRASISPSDPLRRQVLDPSTSCKKIYTHYGLMGLNWISIFTPFKTKSN